MKQGGYFKAVFLRELRRFSGSKQLFILAVVMPVGLFAFFTVLFYRGVPDSLPVAILDYDNTQFSRMAANMIEATPMAHVAYDISSEAEGEKLMREGKIDAFVVMPRDMEKNVMRGSQARVVAYISGLNILKSGLLNKDISTAIQSLSVGTEASMLVAKGKTPEMAMALAMPIGIEKHVLFNPLASYAYYLLPCMLPLMLIWISILVAVYAVGSELRDSTSKEWIDAAGGSITTAYIAKLLPYFVIMWIMSWFMDFIQYDFMGLPLAGSRPMMMLGTMLLVGAYMSLGLVSLVVTASLRFSLSIGAAFSALSFSFCGLTFPFIAMEGWVVALGHLFPMTYYIELFIDQSMRGAWSGVSMIYITALAAFTLLPMALLPRLKTLCMNEKYWGKE